MKEFAFDIMISAVARVKAVNEDEARMFMDEILEGVDLNFVHGPIKLTEASIVIGGDDEPELFEIDGKEV